MNTVVKHNYTVSYLKAVGIMLMVLGHSAVPIPHFYEFICMFHMPLFFMASGYCFKEKYLVKPESYVKNKLKGIWWPFVKWGVLLLLLHNVFFHLNIYNGQYGYCGTVSHLYTLQETGQRLLQIVLKMRSAEQLLGGYWFLNALFFGSIIAWITIKLDKRLCFGGGFCS